MLFLIERAFDASVGDPSAEFEQVKEAAARAGAELIDVQVSKSLARAYFVVELDGPAARIEAPISRLGAVQQEQRSIA